MDPDAWLLARTAQVMGEHGVWNPSRPPAYPLVEFALSGLIAFGSTVTNLVSAALTAVAAALGCALLARQGVRAPWAIPTAVVGLPAIAIPAASTLDHPWALALLALAALCLTVRSPQRAAALGGFVFGLACAARPPIGIAAPALLAYWYALGGSRAMLRFCVWSVPAAIWVAAGVWCCKYWPQPLTSEGTRPALEHMLTVGSIGAFGVVGLVVTVGLALHAAIRPRDGALSLDESPARVRTCSGWIAILTGLEFLAFPLEANYLGVTLFFGALWLAPLVNPRVAIAAMLAVYAGGVASFDASGVRAGQWRRDTWARESQAGRLRQAVPRLLELRSAVHVLAGPDSDALRFLTKDQGPRLEPFDTVERAKLLRARGVTVMTLQEVLDAPGEASDPQGLDR